MYHAIAFEESHETGQILNGTNSLITQKRYIKKKYNTFLSMVCIAKTKHFCNVG